MQTVLQIQRCQRKGVAEFFENGQKHDRAKTYRIAGNDDEHELPGQAGAEESVIKAGVSDRWRILSADGVEHEVQGRKDEKAPEKGDVKHDTGKFHRGDCKRKRMVGEANSRFEGG